MSITHQLSVLVFTVFILYGSTKNNSPASGPYTSTLTSVGRCEKTSYPLHPKPTMLLTVELYNTSIGTSLRGNFTVLKDTSSVRFTTKSFVLENGKWKSNFGFIDNGCRGSFVPLFVLMAKIKFDKQTCTFRQGRVPFDFGNTNKIYHTITSTAQYGKAKFLHEVFVKERQSKTLYCYEFLIAVEPLHNTKE